MQENPYQSPKGESANEPPRQFIFKRYPTWRFWALALICIPGFLLLLVPVGYIVHAVNRTQEHLFVTIPYGAAILTYLFACVLIFVRWRSPARLPDYPPKQRRIGLLMLGLWLLGLLAAPSAFMSLCAPTSLALIRRAGNQPPRLELGVVWCISVIGPALVIFLAHGLWLDAVGRKPPSPQEAANLGPVRDRHPFQDGGK